METETGRTVPELCSFISEAAGHQGRDQHRETGPQEVFLEGRMNYFFLGLAKLSVWEYNQANTFGIKIQFCYHK